MPDVRPIDANALKESARKVSAFRTYDAGSPDLRTLVDSAPTLDYAPVRHGEWCKSEIVGYDGIHAVYAIPCSLCGKYTIEYRPHFCPNCGAVMDGGKENGDL